MCAPLHSIVILKFVELSLFVTLWFGLLLDKCRSKRNNKGKRSVGKSKTCLSFFFFCNMKLFIVLVVLGLLIYVLRIVPHRIIHEHDKCLYSWVNHPLINRFLRGPFGCLCCTIKFNMVSELCIVIRHFQLGYLIIIIII